MNMIRLPLLVFLTLLGPLDSNRPLLAQALPAIQLFMPDGTLPTREVRLWLMRSKNNAEIRFTDKKGHYQFTPELIAEGEYMLIVDTDKRNFETTRYRFRLAPAIAYIPVFLLPLLRTPPPVRLISVTEYDAKVPPEARSAYEMALKEAAAGRTTIAINEFTRALMLQPQYPQALNDLGMLYLKLNRLEEAAAAFTQAVSLNSSFHLPRLNLGLVRNRQGRYDEAVTLLNALVKDQPSLGQARTLLAEGLIVSKQWDEAESHLREGLKDQTLERSTQAEAHLKLGRVFSNQERYKAAALEIEQAITIEPESAIAQLQLGAVYLQLGKLAEAEAALLKAYALAGKRIAVAQVLLGQLYYDQQKYESALRAFEQYLADAPNAANAAQIKEAIEKIKVALKK
jgi:tetratricopeptide (TPR) repeat protein